MLYRVPNPDARRLFLDRHLLAEPPSGPAKGDDLARLVDRLGFVQVDSIRTVERAHHMILWSRRQSYRPADLAPLTDQHRSLWEHWTHDASILPMAVYPYWRHRFQRDAERLRDRWQTWFRPGYEAQFDTILRRIESDGPVTTAEVGEGEARGKGGWWDWHPSKTALEWLWRTGQLAITRREGFQKVYDLTERVIPAAHLGVMPDADAMVDWACSTALAQLGFADPGEIRDYWRAVTPAEVKDWLRAAKADGRVTEVEVVGAKRDVRRAFALPQIEDMAAKAADPSPRLRILSPFDPALRDRDRAEFLFGFHYRIEVFVPEPKRQFGYYVFPVMEGDRLIARLDAKAHRDAGELRLRAVWPEAGIAFGKARIAKLDAELHRLARLAECDKVVMAPDWLRPPQGFSLA